MFVYSVCFTFLFLSINSSSRLAVPYRSPVRFRTCCPLQTRLEQFVLAAQVLLSRPEEPSYRYTRMTVRDPACEFTKLWTPPGAKQNSKAHHAGSGHPRLLPEQSSSASQLQSPFRTLLKLNF
jgi:hypothetical protein